MSEEAKETAVDILEKASCLSKHALANVSSYVRGYADALAEKEEGENDDAGEED